MKIVMTKRRWKLVTEHLAERGHPDAKAGSSDRVKKHWHGLTRSEQEAILLEADDRFDVGFDGASTPEPAPAEPRDPSAPVCDWCKPGGQREQHLAKRGRRKPTSGGRRRRRKADELPFRACPPECPDLRENVTRDGDGPNLVNVGWTVRQGDNVCSWQLPTREAAEASIKARQRHVARA